MIRLLWLILKIFSLWICSFLLSMIVIMAVDRWIRSDPIGVAIFSLMVSFVTSVAGTFIIIIFHFSPSSNTSSSSGVCSNCGYDLRGNLDAKECPECGSPNSVVGVVAKK